jgi:hypothetical protein
MKPIDDRRTGFQLEVDPSAEAFRAIDLIRQGKPAEAEKLIKSDGQRRLEAAERLFGSVAALPSGDE